MPKASTNDVELNNPDPRKAQDVYGFQVEGLDGGVVRLVDYRGCFLLVVNIARNTGFAWHNYRVLNSLYDKYKDLGLRILAFPCTQTEPNECTDSIVEDARSHGVQFDILGHANVNCDNTSPLWDYLKQSTRARTPHAPAVVKSSFVKFVINRQGIPTTRLGPAATEDDIYQDIKLYLPSEYLPW